MSERDTAGPGFEPLLDQIEREPAREPATKPKRGVGADALRGAALAVIGVAVGAGVAWSGDRTPPPDPSEHDPFGGQLTLALLDDDFNSLPIERRLEIVRELMGRINSMDSGDSALLAAFAAGLVGEARAQLEKNARRLMIDYLDLHAKGYATVPPDQREAFLAETLREMLRLQRELTGDETGEEDLEEGVERVRERAAREEEILAERRTSQLAADNAADFMRWAQREGESTGPNQRARMVRFMRDMTRFTRGQDLETGKPKR